MRPLTFLALVLLALVLPVPVLAQAYQCSLPQRVAKVSDVRPDGPTRRTPIASYTLAASWSPEYCKRGGDSASMQCSGANGRFGFVLHGLWPEAGRGPPPQWCATSPQPSPDLIRRNLCMTPAPWLLAHEWAKHGSCMARTPEGYYRVSAILWRSLRWPDADRLSRKRNLTAGDLREAFYTANPDWRGKRIGLLTSRNGWLREMKLCYDRKFMPKGCARGSLGPADSQPLKIWRGL